MKRLFLRVLIAGLIIPLFLPFRATHALSFDPENILSDEDFFNASDMTREDIQYFLERKGSALATYTAFNADGARKAASDIIGNAAVANGVNPKVLLVILQKEQSLIENSSPTQYNYDWATGFARCDSCSTDSPSIAAYKGFSTQVEKAASRSTYYITNPSEFSFRKGVESIIDGIRIVPKTRATAALYNYTPHIRGNALFWRLWQRYFGKIYPDGMVVREEHSPTIWLIQQEKKRAFTSASVFLSRYHAHDVVVVHDGALDTYKEGQPIRFAQYSLLRVPQGGIYLMVGDGKYAIPSKKIFQSIGFNPDEVIQTSAQDVASIPTVGILSSQNDSPIGELLQDKKTGGIFYVEFSKKHPILERTVLQTNFPYMSIRPAAPKELATYTLADPVVFADGTLVKTPLFPTVYVISNGQRRAIATEHTFETLGFQWSQVVTSTGETLARLPEGEPIAVETEQENDEEFSSELKGATLN